MQVLKEVVEVHNNCLLHVGREAFQQLGLGPKIGQSLAMIFVVWGT